LESLNLLLFLSAGLGLGLLHAFDPDHLAAVGALGAGSNSGSMLSTQTSNSSSLSKLLSNEQIKYWQYALRWSLGHGSALLFIAVLVYLIGLPIPVNASHLAEQSVAFLLILLGSLSLFKESSLSIPAFFTRSEGPISNKFSQFIDEKRAGLMGLVHGTAGSASLFALIPIAKVGSMSIALGYVLSFSAGVVLAMYVLGSLMSLFLKKMSVFYRSIHTITAVLFSLLAVVLGFFLLLT